MNSTKKVDLFSSDSSFFGEKVEVFDERVVYFIELLPSSVSGMKMFPRFFILHLISPVLVPVCRVQLAQGRDLYSALDAIKERWLSG